MHEPRTYRHWIKDKDLVSFTAVVKETDLHIRAHSNLKPYALKVIKKYRKPLEEYIKSHPIFLHSLEPFYVEDNASEIVKEMANAGWVVSVGPMAAVAGAIAEAVGKDLLTHSPEVVVENGGDIFMKSLKKRLIGIYAGRSSFTGKIALEIEPNDTPLGICTSSGTIGHSISFGVADAVIVLSQSTPLADAAATAIGNHIKSAEDIETEIKRASHIQGLSGLIIIKDDKLGVWGKVKLVSQSKGSGN